MFIQDINPVLVQIGPLAIRYYSLVYVAGFLIAYYMLLRLVKKNEIKNLTQKNLDTYILLLIAAIIIGARLAVVLVFEPGYYFSNPIEILKIWHGGLSFHGGLVGAALVTIWFCKKYKVKFYDIADILAIPGALMLGFGRIANFINGELYGIVTNSPIGVNFHHETNAAGELIYRHPSQLYEAAKNFFIFGVLMILRTRKNLPKGFLFWTFITLYGYLRFIINFWRETMNIWGLPMSGAQMLSLVMGIIGTIVLVRNYWLKKAK